MARFKSEALLQARLESGRPGHRLKQSEVALELGISERTYRKYERGTVNEGGFDPTHPDARAFLIQCEAFFGLAFESLVEDEPPAVTPPAREAQRAVLSWRMRLPAVLAADGLPELSPPICLDLGEATPYAPGARTVVLGEPGAGKSTWARQEAARLCRRPTDAAPVVVELASLPLDRPLFTAATDLLAFALGPEERGAMAAALAGAPVVVFLDGFDEVHPEAERAVLRRINYWAQQHPQAAWIVLSRPTADPTDALPGFARLRLRALRRPEQLRLLTAALGGPGAEPILAEAEARGLGALMGLPLAIELLAVAAGEGGAPGSRRALLSVVVHTLLRRGPRGVGGVKDPQPARVVMQRLALRLHDDGGERWPEPVVAEVLLELSLTDRLVGHILRTWGGVGAFLDDVARNSGLFGPLDGPKRPWRFLHRAIREALVAEALAVDEAARARARRALSEAQGAGRRSQVSRWALVMDLVDDESVE